jgi:hypothetical protein
MEEEFESAEIEADRQYLQEMINQFVGQKYIFEDGDSLEVIQIKTRGPGQHYVSYRVQQGPGIPRKLVLPLWEFKETYGYLFDSSLE